MVDKIFHKTQATYPLPPNIPHKTLVKSGKTYVYVGKEPVKVSRCTSLVKALGLTLLTAYSFFATLISKKFRASLAANWRATFKGNRLAEKYELAKPTSTHNSSAASLNKHSTVSPKKSPPKPKTPEPVKKPTKAKKTKPPKPAKISDKEIPAAVNYLLSSQPMPLSELETYRYILKLVSGRKSQDYLYRNNDPNIAFIDSKEFKTHKIPFDTYKLQQALRYMVLKGDIVAYQPARVGFRLALNQDGLKTFEKTGSHPFTQDLILKMHNGMKKLPTPVMPQNFNVDEVKLWNGALDAIKRELYFRHLRVQPEDKAATPTGGHTCLFYKKPYDELVLQGFITEWNATSSGHAQPILKIGKNDTVESQYLAFKEWRNIDVIKAGT